MHIKIGKPIRLRWQLVFQHSVIMMVTTQGPTNKNDILVRQGHDRVFQCMPFFFRCNTRAVWHPLVTDDRPVRWHQSGGDPRPATPLSTPPGSSTRDRA